MNVPRCGSIGKLFVYSLVDRLSTLLQPVKRGLPIWPVEKRRETGNAAQLSAYSELIQSIKSPEKRRIQAKSEKKSLSCRLSGGEGGI
jgi:hypothetical protein